jgi:heptosyltransferase I
MLSSSVHRQFTLMPASSFARELGLLDAAVAVARSGIPTLKCGDRFVLSAYDPAREAARRAAEIMGERVRLVGLGLAYLLEALESRCAGIIGFEGEAARIEEARPDAARAGIARTRFVDGATVLESAIIAAMDEGETVVLDPSLRAAPGLWAALREFLVERKYRRVALNLGAPRATTDLERLAVDVLKHQTTRSLAEFGPVDVELRRYPTSSRRILVIQPSSIGDVLYITPGLAALRDAHPEAWIGYVVEEEAAEVLKEGSPDELFIARRREWTGEEDVIANACARRFLARLESAGADLILNPHTAARSAFYATSAARAGGCVVGLSFASSGRLQLAGGPDHLRFNRTAGPDGVERPILPPPPGLRQALNESGRLARMLGVGRVECRIRFTPDAASRASSERFLRECGLGEGTRFVAIHTGSNDPKRRYRRAAWPRVAEVIVTKFGHGVVWIGGPADAERNAWIRERTSVPTYDATARGGIGFTTSLLARAAMLIGPETSTVHFAAAVDCPTLTITWPRWVAAFSARSLVLWGPDDPPWCGLMEPELVAAAAGFVFGHGPMPPLPNRVEASWTGERTPNEFLRELHPVRSRVGREYAEGLLSLAWERVCASAQAAWGYGASAITAEEARDWLGPSDAPARAVVSAWAEELASLVQGDSLPAGRNEFWDAFFKPLALCPAAVSIRTAAVQDAREFLIAVISGDSIHQ